MQTITGYLDKIFFNKNGFLIGKLADGTSIKGNIGTPQNGLKYELSGDFKEEIKYGTTFVFNNYKIILPEDVQAIERYLLENIRWIGPVAAKKITQAFGEKALQVCKTNFEAIAELGRPFTLERAKEIAQNLQRLEDIEKIEIELNKIFSNVPVGRIKEEIKNLWGKDVLKKIFDNPYELIRFDGISFIRADQIAKNIGFDQESNFRILAASFHILMEIANSGSTWAKLEMFLDRTEILIGIDRNKILDVITKDNLFSLELSEASARIALLQIKEKEKRIAKRLIEILRHKTLEPIKNIDLSSLKEDQKIAIEKTLHSNVFILTGAPGTGKTYTVKTILSHFENSKFLLLAPTGKAAKRLSELTEREASTIHRCLAKETNFLDREKATELYADLIIIDEMSMVTVDLFSILLKYIMPTTKLILVGDIHQLPSIGAGNVLGDMINAGIPSVELTEIKRQNPGLIVTNCHKIKDGKNIEINNKHESQDFHFSEENEPEEILKKIVNLFDEEGKRLITKFNVDPLKEVQIISPLREKTILGCKSLNFALRKKINFKNMPSVEEGEQYEDEENVFWIGDKVIQLKNDYELGVINGDIGYILEQIYIPNAKAYFYNIAFEGIGNILIPCKKNNLQLAYAVTVHKYQGSEAPIIIFPIHKCLGGTMMLQRNLLYTAISRASKACLLIGQSSLIPKIIEKNDANKRNTFLEEMLLRELQ